MKRSRMLFLGMLVLLLAFTLVFAGCGGPKSLAKQAADAEKAGDFAKLKTIQEKVEKLSEKDQEIFLEEYMKLSD